MGNGIKGGFDSVVGQFNIPQADADGAVCIFLYSPYEAEWNGNVKS